MAQQEFVDSADYLNAFELNKVPARPASMTYCGRTSDCLEDADTCLDSEEIQAYRFDTLSVMKVIGQTPLPANVEEEVE